MRRARSVLALLVKTAWFLLMWLVYLLSARIQVRYGPLYGQDVDIESG